MAEVHESSAVVASLDAQPSSRVGPITLGGVKRTAVGTHTTNSDDSANSTYRFVRIPARARITSVYVHTNAASTNGTADVGLHLAEGGAVLDADFFSAAFAIKTASGEAAFGNTARYGDEMLADKRISDILDIDPNTLVDVTMTVVEAISVAANKLAVEVEYVLDE